MKLAIFDIDGTLTNTNAIDSNCFLQALGDEFAIDSIDTNWSNYPYTTDSCIIRQLFSERFSRLPSADDLARFQRRFMRLLETAFAKSPEAFCEVPGASHAFKKLQTHAGWKAAIATGGWRISANFKLGRIGIDPENIPAAFADDCIAREEIIQVAIDKARRANANGSFDKIVSIGDGVWDVRAARNLGLPFVGVDAERNGQRLRDQGVDEVLSDFTDFEKFLQALDAAKVPKQA
jgi:phosphoglycolate phosphatase-like HAD superfamily hydrolase